MVCKSWGTSFEASSLEVTSRHRVPFNDTVSAGNILIQYLLKKRVLRKRGLCWRIGKNINETTNYDIKT